MKISELELKRVMEENPDEWLDFLQDWDGVFDSDPVSSTRLLEVFKQSKFSDHFLVKNSKEASSVLNKLLWRNRGKDVFGYVIRLVDITETGYPRQYCLKFKESVA